MDAYENMIARKRRKRRRWLLALGIGIPVAAVLTVLGLLVGLNRFRVDVTLKGDSVLVLEYGERYTDPGAEAVFSGSMFLRKGEPIPVQVDGTVDTQKVGVYTLTYSAARSRWQGSAVRTVRVVDVTPPVLILKSRPGTYVIPGQAYQEEGFSARDNYDGDITDRVQRVVENGVIHYSVTDSSGNRAMETRKIVYYDPVAPELKLLGESKVTITAGETFREPGWEAWDNCDGDLTGQVQVTGQVNCYQAGTYTLTYCVKDSYGNTATAVRTVKVKAKPRPQTETPAGKVIYLTFDDGPGPYTRQLLDVLKKYNVKATFFVINSRDVHLVRDIAAEGHAVGIHSMTHDYRTIYKSEGAYFDDLYGMQAVIEEKCGVKTTLVRFPGGSSNTVSSFNPGIMTRLTQAVEDMGFQYYDWNVDSDDAGKTRTTEGVVKNVIAGVKRRRTAVVLQHDVKPYSVAAVEQIIQWGLENGYTFLPLNASSPMAHHRINN